MNRFLRGFVLCLFAIVLVIGRGASRAANEPPVVIPVILSMTGGGAFVGKEVEATLRRIEALVNRQGGIAGRTLQFRVNDDQTKPEVAFQLANGIVSSGAQILIGPLLTNQCLAVQPLIQTRIVQYCLAPGVDYPKGSFSFSASVASTDIFRAMVRYVAKKGWHRVAAITTADATGQQSDQRLAAAMALPENKGVELVEQEHFSPNDLSVTAQIAKIKAARPQVLFAWVLATPLVTVLRSLSDAGIPVPVVASNSNMVYDELRQWTSYMPAELLFSSPAFLGGSIPKSQQGPIQQFTSVMKEAGVVPDLAVALPWDPAMIVISALQKVGPSATAAQIQAYIANLHGYPGILGVYDFRTGNQRGLTQGDMTVVRWDAKQSTWLAVSRPGGDPI